MPLRFGDWTGPDAAMHARLSASANDFARRLEPQLNAFAEFESEAIPVRRGALDGMPYAAKDMFVSATRMPHGGLAKPLLIGAGVIGGLILLTRGGKAGS